MHFFKGRIYIFIKLLIVFIIIITREYSSFQSIFLKLDKI
jgi:hypothetical protein